MTDPSNAGAVVSPDGRVDAPISAKQARRRPLDGIRGVAALGVILLHCVRVVPYPQRWTPFGSVIDNLGNFGVAVFFVLSGYLLFGEFVRWILFDGRRTSIPKYFERRALRIYPAYWAALIGMILVMGSNRVIGDRIGMFTLFGRSFDHTHTEFGLFVAWTLMIEVLFYIFLPPFAALLRLITRRHDDPRRRVRIVIVAVALLAVFAHVWIAVVVSWQFGDPAYLSNLPTYLGWFAAGMMCVVAVSWRDAGHSLPHWLVGLATRTWACWVIAVLFYAAAAADNTGSQRLLGYRIETITQLQFRLAFQAFAALFFVLPVLVGGDRTFASRLLGRRTIAWIGLISYGIYLWHTVVMQWILDHYTMPRSWWGFVELVALVTPAAILLGWLSHVLIERPAIRLGRR